MRLTMLVHVVAGGLSLLAGYVALYSTKGAPLHRRSGMLFVYAMLIMSCLGALISAVRGIAMPANISAGMLTAYLVITALTTVRPLAAIWARWLDPVLMLVALSIGLVSLVFAFEAVASGTGKRNGIPAFPFFLFGVVGTLAGLLDLRRIRRGGLQGASRISRHLWRMCFALFIAAMSFFLGQAKVIPKPIRIPALLALPVLAVLVTMFYWLWRVRVRRTGPRFEQRRGSEPSLLGKEQQMRIETSVTRGGVGREARPVITQRAGRARRGLFRTLLVLLLAPAAVAWAQDPTAAPAPAPAPAITLQPDPLSAFNKRAYGQLKIWLVASAQKMPEADYDFQPTAAVRSFGQILGHVADAQYLFCSTVLGEPNPAPKVELTGSSKADRVAALEQAFAFCDRAYDGMTDTSGLQSVKFFGGDLPQLSVLSANVMHCTEHYGNLVTYLRLRDIVPPSSEPAGKP